MIIMSEPMPSMKMKKVMQFASSNISYKIVSNKLE